MSDLIGYEFFTSQKQFEEWQIENETFKVHTVQPSANKLAMRAVEKDCPDLDGDVEWGVFVTYIYPRHERAQPTKE